MELWKLSFALGMAALVGSVAALTTYLILEKGHNDLANKFLEDFLRLHFSNAFKIRSNELTSEIYIYTASDYFVNSEIRNYQGIRYRKKANRVLIHSHALQTSLSEEQVWRYALASIDVLRDAIGIRLAPASERHVFRRSV